MFYKNELTDKLCDAFKQNRLSYKYMDGESAVMDDEIVLWAGKKNGLKVVVCDKSMYRNDNFKVIRTGTKGEDTYEVEVFNGASVKGVVSTVKRVLESFKAKRDFYLKSKKK